MTATLQRLGAKVIRAGITVFAVAILALLVAGVMLLVQTRSDYYARESVKLAAGYAEQVMAAIEGHQARYKTFPASLSDLSLPAGDPGYVPKLAIDASTGALSIAVETEHGKFGSLRYVPTQDSTNEAPPQTDEWYRRTSGRGCFDVRWPRSSRLGQAQK